jgi:site-specific DNA-methyltransferase (adenine-specific)
MKLTTTKITELSLDPSNVRKHSRRNLDAIKASLRKFGQQKPIVVDAKGIVLAGNGTLTAAQELGWTEIQIVRTELAGVEATAFAIADNRTAELAEWEEDKLSQVLQSIKVEDADLLAATGYDAAEVDKMSKAEVTEDEVPEPPAEPITKPGDLWILGEHRLLCGDSTKAEDVERLIQGSTIGSVITDPPFGMEFVSNYRTVKHKPISGDATTSLLVHACGITADHSSYVFCRWDNLSQVPAPTSLITWVKNNWSMGDLEHAHARQTEVALFYRGKNHSFPNGRPTDVVQHPRTGNDLHPTEKPVILLAEIIRWSIGLVFDPFLGSGTTLIAAEQLGRKCYGMEISPAYCDVIVKRWQNLTGKKAVLDKPTT